MCAPPPCHTCSGLAWRGERAGRRRKQVLAGYSLLADGAGWWRPHAGLLALCWRYSPLPRFEHGLVAAAGVSARRCVRSYWRLLLLLTAGTCWHLLALLWVTASHVLLWRPAPLAPCPFGASAGGGCCRTAS